MATEPAAAVASDPLDAIAVIETVLDTWYTWGHDLQRVSNDLTAATWFGEHVLDRHKPVDGIRDAWSVRDAVDQWGVERIPAKSEHPWEPDDDQEEVTESIPEWGTPIIGGDEAEGIAGSASTLRRWVKNGNITVVGEFYSAGVRTRLYRRAELLACRAAMKANTTATQFGADTP